MKKLGLILAILALAAPAKAHDFWLQPKSFWLASPGVAPTAILVGHGENRQRWTSTDRIVQLRIVGPDGASDQRGQAGPAAKGGDVPLSFAASGTHLLLFESNKASSDLPALRFNDYATVEGLTPALTLRQ